MTCLETMGNDHPEVRTWIKNQIELPRCCPVSGNPQPGSTLTVCYRVGLAVLEVYSLAAYVAEFVDGHADGTRNMEAMMQQIAGECAGALAAPVLVRARLLLAPSQQMEIICRAVPP